MLADTSAPVRVAILGCGLIGSRWDMPGVAAADGPALTHAAAFSRHPGARIVAFCDTDAAKAQEAVARWGCGAAFASARTLFDSLPVDLAVVATHSSVRAEVIELALAAGVRALVIEKPLATTIEEARRLSQALDAHGAKALVNYSRHWDPTMTALRQQLAAGALGRVQRLVGLYGKGLSNNGSHMIDLAGLLCQARPLRARSLGHALPDTEAAWCGGADPALDAQVQYRDVSGATVQLDLLATDASAFSCFELKLIGTEAICEIRRGGRSVEWLPVGEDPNFAGYRIPGERLSASARNLEAMQHMADEAVALARQQIKAASCDAHAALAVAATVEAIKHSNGQWTSIEEQ